MSVDRMRAGFAGSGCIRLVIRPRWMRRTFSATDRARAEARDAAPLSRPLRRTLRSVELLVPRYASTSVRDQALHNAGDGRFPPHRRLGG